MAHQIEFKNIGMAFKEKQLYQNFNLAVTKGDKILITGKSGIGKSTLLKLLLGFVDQSEGELYINQQMISSWNHNDHRQLFAYVNQDVTLRNGKVIELLKEISTYKHNNFIVFKESILDSKLMDFFEVDDGLLQKEVTQLSGGERQRLGLIISIMLKRPIFLLDEVTSSLDPGLKEKTVEYFLDCPETVIAISHDEVWSSCEGFRKVEL